MPDASPTPATADVRRRRRAATAGGILGLAMGLSNVISYLFVILISWALTPADFGGFSALNTYGVLLAMPAGAFQVVLARRQAAADPTGRRRVGGTGLAATVGASLMALSWAATPLLREAFHLESGWAVLWLAAMLAPMTATGACQGVLLGSSRYGALSAVYLVTASTRCAAAVVALAADLSVAGVFAATFVASVLTLVLALALTRPSARARPAGGLLREIVTSQVSLAGLMALSSIDVVLARHVLQPAESGAYALAALFGRVVFWGTQFLALSVVPALGAAGGGRATVRRAALLVGALGAVVTLICAAVPGLLITVTGGERYADAKPLIGWMALVGTLWAVIQVWLFAEIGSGSRRWLGLLAWGAAAVQAVLVLTWWRESPQQVLAAAGVCAAAVALAGLVLVPGGRGMPPAQEPERVEALGASHE